MSSSGADLHALLREASVSAIRENLEIVDNSEELYVFNRHFEIAFGKVFPSVSKDDQKSYENLYQKMCTQRSRS
jgi:SpoVK/Ycf46/Vps4 family AAA+-type ATPase